MQKISIVIPTLQKNKKMLFNLIDSLNKDESVEEIVVIDNSTQGIDIKCPKLRVILPKENLFVNPSWNLGVKESKNDIVAILNDDITIPEDFCSNVVKNMTPEMGIIGFDRDYIENIPQIMPIPENTDIKLKEAIGRCGYFGIAMFCFKSSYYEIPEDIKIYWGDDWLYFQNKKRGKKNYYISNQKIYHYGSLTSDGMKRNSYAKQDSKLYRKYTRKWWQKIFHIESVYRGIRITLFGIEILYHYDKNH